MKRWSSSEPASATFSRQFSVNHRPQCARDFIFSKLLRESDQKARLIKAKAVENRCEGARDRAQSVAVTLGGVSLSNTLRGRVQESAKRACLTRGLTSTSRRRERPQIHRAAIDAARSRDGDIENRPRPSRDQPISLPQRHQPPHHAPARPKTPANPPRGEKCGLGSKEMNVCPVHYRIRSRHRLLLAFWKRALSAFAALMLFPTSNYEVLHETHRYCLVTGRHHRI